MSKRSQVRTLSRAYFSNELVWPSGKAFVLYFDNFLKHVFHTLKNLHIVWYFLSRALDEDDTGAAVAAITLRYIRTTTTSTTRVFFSIFTISTPG